MKVDFRFHCFGCGADGDVIDLTAKLFQLSLRQAAEKLATDFGLSATDNFQPLPCKPVEKPLSPKEQFYKILCGYRSLLANWRMAYAPKNPEASLHPCFVASLHYCLLPVTKAQKMLLMVGKGGEGKSRIGLILRELFGNSMYTGSLQKVETNRFARADLEYKLLLVDDDMKTEALPQTNNIKTLVTLEDKIDIERKGQQSVQGTLYVRFACFGNGSLHALYDKSNGFYRRQLLLTTKEKPVGRVDDPFLIDKMRNEKEGILLWALEGLHRLIRNNYQFTISERTAANLKEAMEQGNNILGFLKSEGYFEIRQGAKCKSTDFYKVYKRWCLDNLEKPLAASTFIHHLKDNQKSLGIVYDDKCIGTNRGFHNVDVDLFLPVDVPSPWD